MELGGNSHILETSSCPMDYRCQTTHAKEEKRETKQQQRRAEAKIRALYLHKDRISAADQNNIFPKSLEEKLDETAGSLLSWAEMTFPTVKQAVKNFKEQDARTQISLIIPTMPLQLQ